MSSSETPAERSNFLLVDDSDDNLASLEDHLCRDDVQLFLARSGPEALTLCEQYDFALAIIDVQMPGMDGFTLAEKMRATERSRRVPIIFVTGRARDSRLDFEGYEAGAVDVLFKPLNPQILVHKAGVFVELHQQRRDRERLLANEHQVRLEAEEAIKMREEVLAVVSHDLRNPLSSIMITAKLLGKLDHPEVKKHAERMLRVARRMNRMIEDLLDLAFIESGRLKLEKDTCEAGALVRDCSEMLRPVAAQKGIQLVVEPPAVPVQVACDRERMAQVFSNLIGNAIKFTPDGGSITLTAELQGKEALFTVTDTGPGIYADQAPHIFDRFWQGHERVPGTGGVGLGLTITKGIVEAHGGRIWLRAPEGPGASFSFTLPVAAGDPAHAPC